MSSLSTILHSLGLAPGLSKPLPGLFTSTKETPAIFASPPVAQVSPSISNSSQQGITASNQINAANDPCYVEPYNPKPISEVFSPYEPDKAVVYRYRQQQSVNLGSWFVHEAWMTPSVFQCAAGKKYSEIDIAQGWENTQSARFVLERHWDTFITMDDFKYLASIGINTVRLPIGFWNLPSEYCRDTPYNDVCEVYEQSWPRIVRAINMAARVNIGVLVDLHGAVGSQNGEHHSGVSDGVTGLFGNPQYQDKTIKALLFLTKQLSNVTNVVGIQILNEPKNVPELYGFYTKAADAMRVISPTIPLYMHNGFDLDAFTQYISKRSDFVVQDHHSYFVFTPSDASTSASQHSKNVGQWVQDSLKKASDQQKGNLVVDEWSCALTPQSLAGERNKDEASRDFCTTQMEVYNATTAGWSFWAYLKEDCDPGWCFKAAVGRSLPDNFFSYSIKNASSLQSDALQRELGNITSQAPTTTAPTTNPTPNRNHVCRLTSNANNILSTELHSSPLRRRFSIPALRRRNSATSSKAYADGLQTAKAFAIRGLSKLGFRGQYIEEAVQELKLKGADADEYRKSFLRGLQDYERKVDMLLAGPTS